MIDLKAAIIKTFLRLRRYRWTGGSIADQRMRQARQARFIPSNRAVSVDPISVGDLDAEWVAPATDAEHGGVVLYLHGGAYALGSIATHRAFVGRFATTTGTRVLAIDYRLAPEHPFPAALDDAVAAYRWLLSAGYDPARIVIAGDSAGGGLALATIVMLRDAGDRLPACAVCFSPWVDLTLSCASIDTNAEADSILNRDALAGYARLYTNGHDPRDPLVSPLFADLTGLPPILIHVGSDEILLDEVVALCDRARAAGVDAEIEVWPGMFHVFQMVTFLRQSVSSLDHAALFIARHLS